MSRKDIEKVRKILEDNPMLLTRAPENLITYASLNKKLEIVRLILGMKQFEAQKLLFN